MKKVKYLAALLSSVLIAGSVLAGCGSSESTTSTATESYEDAKYATEEAAESAAYEGDYADTNGADATTVVDTSRKLITTVNLIVETENIEQTTALVEAKIKELGGYIESSSISNGSVNAYNSSRYADYTIRVPADKLDQFVDTVDEGTNVISKSQSVEDVTLQYTDIESRKNALKAEEKRLLEFLEQASTIEEMLSIEQRLTDVRYELESIESQLRTFDNKVNYSTINLTIEEVATYTPVEEPTVAERITEGFTSNLVGVGRGLLEIFIWFVTHIPSLILVAVIVLAIIFIIKKVDKNSRAKKYQSYNSNNNVTGEPQNNENNGK